MRATYENTVCISVFWRLTHVDCEGNVVECQASLCVLHKMILGGTWMNIFSYFVSYDHIKNFLN